MKSCLKVVLTVAVMSLVSMGAQAAPTCSFDAAGTYNSKNGKVYEVIQNGCQLKVSEIRQEGGNLRWSFDLSGNTTAGYSPDFIAEVKALAARQAQQGLEQDVINNTLFEEQRLQSEVIRTTLLQETPTFEAIRINGSMNLPKFDANPFDIDVSASALALASGVRTSSGALQVTNLHIQEIKVRFTNMRDTYYTGVLANAFLAGANYVLSKISFDSLTDDVELTKVK